MKLDRYETMDPNLLIGLVNTALRNEAESLGDLVRQHDISRSVLEERLAEIGYRYVPEVNQFKAA